MADINLDHLREDAPRRTVGECSDDHRFERATDQVEALFQLVSNERGTDPDRVLDVACGTGWHVLAFVDHGCRAEGLDFSKAFVDRRGTE